MWEIEEGLLEKGRKIKIEFILLYTLQKLISNNVEPLSLDRTNMILF